MSPDATVFTFKLRKGVTFPSGVNGIKPTRDFNADDVRFSIERQWKADHPCARVSCGQYDYFAGMGLHVDAVAVEKLDLFTVRITLMRPNVTMLAEFAALFPATRQPEAAVLQADEPQRQDPVRQGLFQAAVTVKALAGVSFSVLARLSKSLRFGQPRPDRGRCLAGALMLQPQVLNLLVDLQQALGPGGRTRPAQGHLRQDSAPPCTQALLSATPTVNPALLRQRVIVRGELPSPIHPPSGCAFHTRCPLAVDRCRQQAPALFPRAGGADGADGADGDVPVASSHRVACLAVHPG